MLLLSRGRVRGLVQDDIYINLCDVVLSLHHLGQARVLHLHHLLELLRGHLVALLRGFLELFANGDRLIQAHPLQVVLVVGDAHPLRRVPELLDAVPDLAINAALEVAVTIEDWADLDRPAMLQAVNGPARHTINVTLHRRVSAGLVQLGLGVLIQRQLTLGIVLRRVDLHRAITERPRRHLDPAVRLLQLLLGLMDVRNNAFLCDDLTGRQHEQRLGPAVINLNLRVNELADIAIAVVVAVDVAALGHNRQLRITILINQRGRLRLCQQQVAGVEAQIPLAIFQVVVLAYPDALALKVKPQRAVLERLAVAVLLTIQAVVNVVRLVLEHLLGLGVIHPHHNAHIRGVGKVQAAAVRVVVEAVPRHMADNNVNLAVPALGRLNNGSLAALDQQALKAV